MSVRVMATVWASSTASDHTELVVELALADRAGDDGVVWMPVAELARKTRLSERHLLRITKRFVEEQRLQVRKVQRRRKRINVYRFNLPGLAAVDYDRLPFQVDPFDDMTRRHVAGADDMTRVSSDDMTPRVRVAPQSGAETSVETPPASARARVREERDAIWDTVVEVTGISPETKGEQSRFGKSVAELAAAGATPDEIRARARRYTRKYEGAALTDRALATRWGELAGPRPRTGRRTPPCAECGIGGGLHLVDCSKAARPGNDGVAGNGHRPGGTDERSHATDQLKGAQA